MIVQPSVSVPVAREPRRSRGGSSTRRPTASLGWLWALPAGCCEPTSGTKLSVGYWHSVEWLGYTTLPVQVPFSWREDPRWRTPQGGGSKDTPSHRARYPSR